MSRVEPRLYNLALYALLHDVGKPILRFALRYSIEKDRLGAVADEARGAVEEFFGEDIVAISKKKHDEISKALINRLLGVSLSEADESYFNSIIKSSDVLAASERGLIPAKDEFMKRVQSVIAEEVRKQAQLPYSYSHEYTPLLTPTWLLLKAEYLKFTGFQDLGDSISGKWSGTQRRSQVVKDIFYPLHEAIESENADKLSEKLVDILVTYAKEPLWIPVRPLLPREVVELHAYSLEEAMKRTSYSEVVLLLLKMLITARDIYGVAVSVPRGFVDTVENILKVTTFLVPSAIYWSLVPDISLYSHSKLAASYAIASQLGEESRLRLLTIDANNIQGFIAAPVKAAAASRVMRGRSILLELVLDTITEYALELFGKLPQANVIVSEGGTIDIVVPDSRDFEEKVRLLRGVGFELSKYLGGLVGFSIAYSKPFTVDDMSFQRTVEALAKGASLTSFSDVLESLAHSLAVEKARTGCKAEVAKLGGVVARESEIEGFDAITCEPVLKDPLDPLKLSVIEVENLKKYADVLSGQKLEVGEEVSTPTHLSLALGTASRELVAVVSIHVYRYDHGVARPDDEAIERIYDELHKSLRVGADVVGPLIIKHEGVKGQYSETIAFAPLKPASALYVLISLPVRIAGVMDVEDPRHIDVAFTATYSTVARVLSTINQLLQDLASSGKSVRVKIRFINAPHLFIFTKAIKTLYTDLPSNTIERLSKGFSTLADEIKRLVTHNVDVVFGFAFLGLYHPAIFITTKEGEIVDIALADLDSFGIIAVAKMDFDMFGEVRALYSISPSRLVTLSDLLNIVVAEKAYLKVVRIAKELAKGKKSFDVIPLYAGGDDVTVYGKWSHVVYYLYELYKDIRSVLLPLTSSIGIAIGDSTEPLLLLYRHAVHLLEEYAKKVKASCIIGAPYKVLYPSTPQPQGKEATCSVMPLEKPSNYYPWYRDPLANWNLELLAKILGILILSEKTDIKTRLEELKRELYMLATIAHEFEEALDYYEAYRSGKVSKSDYQSRVVPIEILYAYMWSRRSEDLAKLKKLFEEVEGIKAVRVLGYPEDIVSNRSIEEALRLLLAAKPVIDFIILALRRPDAVEPSKLVIEAKG